ncbi:hypothetical protein [Streptomyces sp. NPDC001635]|nr:hypothetical protein E4K10_46710 [Streptomyces sp. T1317-0309]
MSVYTAPQPSYTQPTPNHFPGQLGSNHFPPQHWYGLQLSPSEPQAHTNAIPFAQGTTAVGQQALPDIAMRYAALALSTVLVECARWIMPAIQTGIAPAIPGLRGGESQSIPGGPFGLTGWSNGTNIPQIQVL